MSAHRIVGWLLDEAQRAELLQQFPPAYPNVVAHHVTLAVGAAAGALPAPTTGEIVGRVDDGRGVEALVVRVDGGTERPGGGHYHITWSLGAGRTARESNDAITALGWTPVALGMPVLLAPARLR